MKTTPSANVSREVPALRSRWVEFRRSKAPVHLRPPQVEALDAHWAGLGLEGAVVMHTLWNLPGAGPTAVTLCEDELLTANVLYRTRSGLLHAAFTLTHLYLDVTDRGWCTDDPRLVELVTTRSVA